VVNSASFQGADAIEATSAHARGEGTTEVPAVPD
jgi:hypothetical protein